MVGLNSEMPSLDLTRACSMLSVFRRSLPLRSPHTFSEPALCGTLRHGGHVRAFLELALESVPELVEVLRSAQLRAAASRETQIADWLYDQIAPMDFSRRVLTPGVARLVSMALGDIEWDDLGNPERVISTLAKRDLQLPAWAHLWQRKRKAERAPAEMSAAAVA